MSIVYRTGNIFDTKCECIGHGVNCCGAMAAGIAGQIASLFPFAKQCYLRKNIKDGWVLGEIQPVDCGEKIIINMATQYYPGPDAKYDAIRETLEKTFDFCQNKGYSTIALPWIGCGIGGLETKKVKVIIEETIKKYPNVILEVWTYKK